MTETVPASTPEQRRPAPVTFIVTQLPPAVCGLGDYSTHLLANLHLEQPPRILVANGAAATNAMRPELNVVLLERNSAALLRRLEETGAGRVVLEYVGYGYQSRCCPLWLLNGLRKWRERNPGGKLVLMLMELWFTPAWWKPDFLLQRLHRCALRRMAMGADKVFVSSEGYARMMRDCIPRERLRIVPVGSNIVPVMPPGSVPRQPGKWILFGRQGSRIVALRGLLPWIKKLHAAGHVRLLQVAGARETPAFNRTEDELIRSALPDGAFEILGRVPEAELSGLLLEAGMALCGQDAGAYTKSTIFMAYASHGVNILATGMRGMKEEPLCWVTHPAELEEAGADFARVLAERSARLSAWFDATASWERIASIYREELLPGAH
jgi:hypothetical protein